MRVVSIACAALALAQTAFAQDWTGTWFTTSGVLVLERDGRAIRGTYGDNPLEGKAAGKVLTFTYRAGSTDGDGRFELAASGHAFEGTWKTSRELPS